MARLEHFIGGRPTASPGTSQPIIDPATGREVGLAPLASLSEIDAAVEAAVRAQPVWASLGLQQRINKLFDLRNVLDANKAEIIRLLALETGKTHADATAEVIRSVEIIGHATATTVLSETPYTRSVSSGINVYEARFPVGVVAAISPFNFPVMIPLLQSMMAIACGNTVVAKPSERNPSALLRLAQLFSEAGLPDGVYNVVLGDRSAVDRIIEHPDVAAITFVGSTPVARHIRRQGVAHGKRVQAFGGGKNHLVVMPDTELDFAADAAVSSAFGAAGQRCMAVSVVVAVGGIGDPLVEAIRRRAADLPMGDFSDASAQLGPVISGESRARISGYVDRATEDGGVVALDGRSRSTADGGFYMGATIIDHVRPGMAAHTDEIFGPVLSIVRVDAYEEALKVLCASRFGNGAAIFTRDIATAERFVVDAPAGQIGLNVPIPSPVYFHGFAGWGDSAFTETKMHGRDTIDFLTRTKTVTTRILAAP